MAQRLVYTRVSRDSQSTARQEHLLREAGLTEDAECVRVFSDPATSTKIPALERTAFRELASYAREGDTLVVSELFRLCRDLSDILAVREWCRERGVRLQVLSGALAGFRDLAADDATTSLVVNVLVSVGQFQRDLQNELTREGVAAARAAGRRGGRRPVITDDDVDAVREAYRSGASIASLARRYGVSRGAIRTAVADLLPGRAEAEQQGAAPEVLTLEIPGVIADYLATVDLPPEMRAALDSGHEIRRGRGYTLRVAAPAEYHAAYLHAAQAISTPAGRKAYRVYAARFAPLGATERTAS
jgi:DNA invertase Pin-like site-specific DNA recombinase